MGLTSSYFTWIIICLAMWGVAGAVVYGIVSLINKIRGINPRKVEKDTTKANKEAIQAIEELVNMVIESKEEELEIGSDAHIDSVKQLEAALMAAHEAEHNTSDNDDSVPEHNLGMIEFSEEIPVAEATEEIVVREEPAENKKSVPVQEDEVPEEIEDETEEEKIEQPEETKKTGMKNSWQGIDDVFRNAFRM